MSHLAEAAGGNSIINPWQPGSTAKRSAGVVSRSTLVESWFALLCLTVAPLGCSGDDLTLPDGRVPSTPPAAITIVVQPSTSVRNTVPLPTQPQVMVQDAGGAPVAGATVTAAIASGGGVVNGTTTILTRAGGIAEFTNLSVTGPAGVHTLRFSAGSASATSAAITVTPGPTSPAHSTATVPDGTAGVPTTITVQARDVSDNMTTGGASVVVGVSGANNATPAVTDHLDGTYIASYTPTSAGTDLVAITVDGSAIGGSPAASTVRSATMSDSRSTLQASPSSVPASTGSNPSTITVTANDAFGNPLAGVDVRFAATGSNNTFAPATATTDAAGHATSAFSSTLSGSRTISATVGGLALSQTQVVTVVPGVADPGQTTAKVPGSGHENHPTVITVQARDQFGNKLVTGGSAVVVTVTGANNAGPIYATDNGDGTYTASYTPPNKGTDYVVITLGGVAISGSPYRSKVG